MSGPAGARKVRAGSRKGPEAVREDVQAQVVQAGAVPTADRDDQVRRLLRADGDKPMPHARGVPGRRRLLGRGPARPGGRGNEEE